MDTTTRLKFPLLAAGQSQKEIFHNEALTIADVLVAGSIEEDTVRNTPPTAPAAGQCWVVGDTPTGVFVGFAANLAAYTIGGWRFVAPVDGMAMTCPVSGIRLARRGGVWERGLERCLELRVNDQKIVGPRQAAIVYPAGGATVDSAARTTINAVIDALRAHGLIDP